MKVFVWSNNHTYPGASTWALVIAEDIERAKELLKQHCSLDTFLASDYEAEPENIYDTPTVLEILGKVYRESL